MKNPCGGAPSESYCHSYIDDAGNLEHCEYIIVKRYNMLCNRVSGRMNKCSYRYSGDKKKKNHTLIVILRVVKRLTCINYTVRDDAFFTIGFFFFLFSNRFLTRRVRRLGFFFFKYIRRRQKYALPLLPAVTTAIIRRTVIRFAPFTRRRVDFLLNKKKKIRTSTRIIIVFFFFFQKCFYYVPRRRINHAARGDVVAVIIITREYRCGFFFFPPPPTTVRRYTAFGKCP